MKVLIRRGTPKDAGQLIDHLTKVLKESNFMLTTPTEFSPTIEEQVKWIVEHQKEGNLLLVAEVNGTIVGSLDFEQSRRERLSHLGYFSISIQEEYCNQGIGRQMISELLEFAKDHPVIEKVCLEVFSHNERAITLYQKLGFKEEGRKVKFVKFSDDDYKDEVEMYQFVK